MTSTPAAKTQSLARGIGDLLWMIVMYAEITVPDTKSLYDLLINETTGGGDRRNALDVQMLREEIKELYGKIRWIERMAMPADCLTKKHGRGEALLSLLRTGRFGITEESKTLQSRLDVRNQMGYNKR